MYIKFQVYWGGNEIFISLLSIFFLHVFSVFNFNQLPNELMAKSLTFFFRCLRTRFKLNIKLFIFSVWTNIDMKITKMFLGLFAFCLMFNKWNRNIVGKVIHFNVSQFTYCYLLVMTVHKHWGNWLLQWIWLFVKSFNTNYTFSLLFWLYLLS